MTKYRIGIDGFNLAMRNGTGVATYAFTLAHVLKAAGHRIEGVFGVDVGRDVALREVMFYDLVHRAPPKNRTRAELKREARSRRIAALRPTRWQRDAVDIPLTGAVEKTAFAERLPDFDRLTSAPRLFEEAFEHFRLYGRFLRVRMPNPPEIMHWTYPIPVELVGSRNVYTLHDLVPLRLPYTTLDTKASYLDIVRGCVERAAHICTVSDASRDDILGRFPINPARVTNTYQHAALPPEALSRDPAEDARAVEGIFGLAPQSYFLFFGAIEPKKNVGRLLEAHLSNDTTTPLVIVGARAWQSEDELRLLPGGDSASTLHGRNMAQRVGRLEYLPRALLLRLIRSARAVVFPSLFEGFGLPVVEAMQLGTPVLTSCTSSLPEVAGDAAILVDPYDVDSIAQGLRRLDGDEALRADLSRRGIEQAKLFSADAYRQRLEAMYARVMQERPL